MNAGRKFNGNRHFSTGELKNFVYINTGVCYETVTMHCPRFIYEIAVARTAAEFLGAEMALETYAKKYAEGLSEHYSEIPVEIVSEAAENMLQFLSEIEAGELAVELLTDFIHFRLMFEGVGRPRKLKPMFGSIEDPAKAAEVNALEAAKAFRAFVFAMRASTAPRAPAGWRLEDDEHLPKFNEIVAKTVSVLDIL